MGWQQMVATSSAAVTTDGRRAMASTAVAVNAPSARSMRGATDAERTRRSGLLVRGMEKAAAGVANDSRNATTATRWARREQATIAIGLGLMYASLAEPRVWRSPFVFFQLE